MKFLLLDDERMALEHMKHIFEKSKRVKKENISTFVSPSDALTWAQKELVDVAFVDIEMPEMNGLAFADKLKMVQPQIEIVFITAYKDYAVEAFEQYALDYLLKPVRLERIVQTLDRIESRIKEKRGFEKSLEITTINVMGNVIIQVNNKEIDLKWRSGRVKELFLLLLHFRERAISKFEIIDIIWPGSTDKKATTHLHMTIYRLRQLIRAHELDISIKFQNDSYQLVLGQMIKTDVDQWYEHLKNYPTVTQENVRDCISALSFVRGRYMENLDYTWANNEQTYLQNLYRNRLIDISRCLSKAQQFDEAIMYYEKVSDLLFHDDGIVLELFQLYALKKRSQDIERLYQRLKQFYQEEMQAPLNKTINQWYKNWKEKN
ncbi:response regulator [Virgibacillus sp. W0181]|uniref:response regulator n=1 Tax=Virgibacillus sp. W0181 TaxID=3391581 RepID=UPI003F4880E3